MNIFRKVKNRLALYFRLSMLKTFYYWIYLKKSTNTHFHIYPHSSIKINRSANFKIIKGTFKVNESWHKGRNRRNISELILSKNSNLIVENNFSLYQGASIFVGEGATLRLKGHSFINTNTVINCFKYIEIGEGTYISDEVKIQDSDNHFLIENEKKKENTKEIIIGDHVWIGKNAIILKGVKIGNGSVVGAGSVVINDVPPSSLVVGNPSKIVKKGIRWV